VLTAALKLFGDDSALFNYSVTVMVPGGLPWLRNITTCVASFFHVSCCLPPPHRVIYTIIFNSRLPERGVPSGRRRTASLIRKLALALISCQAIWEDLFRL
jgi:hypothetical protein